MQRKNGDCNRIGKQSIPIPLAVAFGVKAANFRP